MSAFKSMGSRPPEDLSVLARRGALSPAESAELEAKLERDPILRTAHTVGRDFDRIAVVGSGDGALIARLAEQTVRRARKAGDRGSRRRWATAIVLVATLALGGSAAAWWGGARSGARRAVPVQSNADKHAPQSRPAPSSTAETAPVDSAVAPTVVGPTPPPAAPTASAFVQGSGAGVTQSGPESPTRISGRGRSADALFRDANAARRAGAASAARALYLQLEQEFPNSYEARLAHVSLGKLLLEMGQAAQAEAQFDSYLGGRLALAEEALVGRAQSLAALGRTEDERAVWQHLLSRYPASLYARRARERLSELSDGQAPR